MSDKILLIDDLYLACYQVSDKQFMCMPTLCTVPDCVSDGVLIIVFMLLYTCFGFIDRLLIRELDLLDVVEI